MNDGRSISVASISQDSFYRDLTPEQMILAKKSEYNFDHPDTIDDDEIYRNIDNVAMMTLLLFCDISSCLLHTLCFIK